MERQKRKKAENEKRKRKNRERKRSFFLIQVNYWANIKKILISSESVFIS